MSFYISHNDYKFLSNIFEVVSNILDNVIINFKNDGIYISGMDSNHISLIDLFISESDFTKYDFNSEIDIKLSILSIDIYKILKSADKDDSIIFKYNIKDDNILTILLNSNSFTRNYNLKLLDIFENNEYNIPEVEYTLILELSKKVYNKIINSVSITDSENFAFNINNNKLNINSNGCQSDLKFIFNKEEGINKCNKNKIKLKKKKVNGNLDNSNNPEIKKYKASNLDNSDNKRIIEIKEFLYKLHKCNGNYESTFLFNCLKKISKANNLSERVYIYLNEDTPLKCEYRLSKYSESILKYYIAPKVDI